MRWRRRADAAEVPADRRLRRLRWKLTIAYIALYSVGAVVLTAVAVGASASSTLDSFDVDLERFVLRARGGVYYDTSTDPATLVVGFAGDNDIDDNYQQVFVLETEPATSEAIGGVDAVDPASQQTGWRVAFAPTNVFYPTTDLSAIANSVSAAGGLLTVDSTSDGLRLRAAGDMAAGSATNLAVVIALGDPTTLREASAASARGVWLATAGLIALGAVGGFVLAGRSIRRVAVATEQQRRFLADAAHELRTPIAALRAVADSARAGELDPGPALNRTVAIADSAATTLDDLLLLARFDAERVPLEREPVRLDLLVEEVLDGFTAAGIGFESEGPVVVVGDVSLLRRAIVNLVANAIRHGRSVDPGAGVRVRVRPGEVVVEDDGPGIEPGLLPQVFERFRTGRRSGGSGLGLAIVDWVARAHGGRVEATNRPAGGARLILRVPAAVTPP